MDNNDQYRTPNVCLQAELTAVVSRPVVSPTFFPLLFNSQTQSPLVLHVLLFSICIYLTVKWLLLSFSLTKSF